MRKAREKLETMAINKTRLRIINAMGENTQNMLNVSY